MKHNETIFSGAPSGIRWIALCLLMGAAVLAGRLTGQLSDVCLLLILGFSIHRAVLPYFWAMEELKFDKMLCSHERPALAEVSVDKLDQLSEINAREAGSVFKLAQLVGSTEKRNRKGGIPAFFEAFDSHWNRRLSSIQDAADQAPVLGLAGSLLGIIDALSVLASPSQDQQALYAAMSTMALTTLAGGAAYILISGLFREASNAVEHHRSDLTFISEMLNDGHTEESKTPIQNPLEL